MPPIDDLPGQLIIPGRNDLRDQYLLDVRIRTPDAVTIEGTLEFADASVFADTAVPIYFDIKTIGDYTANRNKSGPALDSELVAAGTKRLLAAGGFGYVKISASVGGGTIFEDDEIKVGNGSLRFRCTATALYTDGQPVPVIGVDTGPQTNLAANTVMNWTFPRPGISQVATVVQQTDGTGLTGGRNDETDSQANDRLVALRTNQPASGNDADFQKQTQLTPGVTIQQVFTYPCIRGPGTIGVTFTLRPGTPGANRVPTAAHLAAAMAWLIGQFPADDSILLCVMIAYPVTIVYQVTWTQQAVSWVDAAPWPPYNPSDLVRIDSAVAATPTTFRLTTGTSTIAPQVGQSIAFYDQPNAVFRRKRILTVAVVVANFSWDIVVDTSNNASDTNYTPVTNQGAGPWSDSLQAVVTPTTDYFDTLGPGEQVSPIPDVNLRQRRTPRSPSVYGNTVTNRITTELFTVPSIADIVLASPATPFATPTGAPGIASYLLSLGSIVVFPQ